MESYPNGKPKVRGTYAGGEKTGPWSTYYESGKLAETTTYRKGVPEGPHQWNAPEGKAGVRATYRGGGFAGVVTVLDERGGAARQPRYPRTLAEVREACRTLYPRELKPPKFAQDPVLTPPYKAGALAPETLDEALKLVKLYRYLSGSPWRELALDPLACSKAQHGAVLLNRIGDGTHFPEKPADMDEAFFKLAFAGCNEGNLSRNQRTFTDSLRSLMADESPANIGKVAHRQWLLWPGLQRTGFGFAGTFYAVHVNEKKQRVVKFGSIAYPGEGYYPRQLVEPNYPWSVHVPYTKDTQPPNAGSVKLRVTRLDERFQPAGGVSTTLVNVDANPSFQWAVIIFQPDWKELGAGKYWVEVFGLKNPKGQPWPLAYVVDLVDVAEIPAPPAATGPAPGRARRIIRTAPAERPQ